jgi:hypothetical protein
MNDTPETTITSKVTALFKTNQHAPTPETVADYLEQLAAKIRAGEFPVTRGVIVTMHTDQPGVAVLPFGAPTDGLQLVGLLEMGKLRAALA